MACFVLTLSPDTGSEILCSCWLGCGQSPPLPMQNLWLHGNTLAGGQVQTGRQAEICCWRWRHDLASCSAAAPAEPRLCEEAGQSLLLCPCVHP